MITDELKKEANRQKDYDTVTRTLEILIELNTGQVNQLFNDEIREATKLLKVLRDAIIMKHADA